jgi:hypothetical protein
VCARFSPPPVLLALSLSPHQHPSLYIPPSSRLIRYNKQQKLGTPKNQNALVRFSGKHKLAEADGRSFGLDFCEVEEAHHRAEADEKENFEGGSCLE